MKSLINLLTLLVTSSVLAEIREPIEISSGKISGITLVFLMPPRLLGIFDGRRLSLRFHGKG